MANYKPYAPNVEYFGIRTPIQGDIIMLYDNTALSASDETLKQTKNDTVYQIPSDRKFTALSLKVIARAGAGSKITLYQGATEDAKTTGKIALHCHDLGGVTEFPLHNIVFASSTFVVMSVTGILVEMVFLVGTETP